MSILIQHIKVVTVVTLLILFSLRSYSQDFTTTVEYDIAKSTFTLNLRNNSSKRMIVHGGWGTAENHAIRGCIYNSYDKCLAEEYYSLSDVRSAIIIEPNKTFYHKLDLSNRLASINMAVKIGFTVEYKYVFEYGEWQKYKKEYHYNLMK